ncbi:MAG: lipoyl synthase [Nitrospirae bacterium]|nr:lipoyl synthase [Nitrospirota bacterium]
MERLPDWLKTNTFSNLRRTKRLLRNKRLSTVCEEARCPNRGHCFSRPTATFMILGKDCTRSCGFCSVSHMRPSSVDEEEPRRVAEAAAAMALTHVVVTSVTRDDLPDGGAGHFAATVMAVRGLLPDAKIEVLTPDFRGSHNALYTVLDAEPDVFNHNVETVPSLYYKVRPQADYSLSLEVLAAARNYSPKLKVKSGLMVGLGERFDEVIAVVRDLRASGCDFITIGQYLRPRKTNIEVVEYVPPNIFDLYREKALEMGFDAVASAPLVRSSMDAHEMLKALL